jgi:NAD(P)-dependent dehydrogenase (short-subunit alcohol dehydrogenase family)
MPDERPLNGKVALVTGASRGIGAAIAKELAALGATVIVSARTDVTRDDIAGTIGDTVRAIEEAGGRAIAVKADLLVPADIDRLVTETTSLSGRLDVLVNNAAYIGEGVFESIWDMSPDTWRNMMELNVNVPWALTKGFAPMMRDQGGGLVVNLSSGAANVPPEPGHPLPGAGGLGAGYPTSKAALTQMNAFIGNELCGHGIAVVALDPGYARSESAEILSARIGADPAWAQPVEVAAKATGYLATCPDPLEYAGRFVVARELVDELGLMPA